MTRHAFLNRAFIALWCVGAAAGCAKLTDEAANSAVTAEEVATLPEPAVAPTSPAAVEPSTPDPAPLAAVAASAGGTQDSTAAAPVTLEVELPAPLPSSAEVAPAVVEPEIVATAVPATAEPERAADVVAPAAAAPLAADTLDLTSLLTRLRKTKAINLRTKLAVKNESDDLLEGFRLYHAEHGPATLNDLRRSYDSLFLKLHSLLEEEDPPLARDIDRSRGAIWAILADPTTFAPSAVSASARSEPRA